MDKNDDTVVIHLPKQKRIQLERLAERKGLNKSEYGRLLIDRDLEQHHAEFEFMKTIFGTEKQGTLRTDGT